LDLRKVGYKHYDNTTGRPSFDEGALVKLYLYGYIHDIRNTRKLVRACKINLEVKWLMYGKQPKYRAIGEFKTRNTEAFNKTSLIKTLLISTKFQFPIGPIKSSVSEIEQLCYSLVSIPYWSN